MNKRRTLRIVAPVVVLALASSLGFGVYVADSAGAGAFAAAVRDPLSLLAGRSPGGRASSGLLQSKTPSTVGQGPTERVLAAIRERPPEEAGPAAESALPDSLAAAPAEEAVGPVTRLADLGPAGPSEPTGGFGGPGAHQPPFAGGGGGGPGGGGGGGGGGTPPSLFPVVDPPPPEVGGPLPPLGPPFGPPGGPNPPTFQPEPPGGGPEPPCCIGPPGGPTPPPVGVPEPGTWAMMILGFFAIGGALRRAARLSIRRIDA